ncbi:SDR family NAD(P)-dependent oxidoreductase [Salinibacter altiplanensis]|uniref:SDR family NAD(P)-dependent oxidoreductase n=1 Tax=Salinibacter altiplanensis TaxID=1803181 RepID=UPI000C9F23CD|nr:glucose 1-dehydrogenase [Salinibacter altiplanensis]
MDRVGGKIVLITGAGHGIGQKTAELLANEGARVAVTDIDEKAGPATVDRIADAGGEAAFFQHDVTSETDWMRVVEEVQATFGNPDVLVNNAGVYHIEPVDEMDVDDWRALMDVNVTGVFLGLKHCTPLMRKQGRGSVVNLSSVAGLVGVSGHTCYGASKGAVRTMTKDAAIELADAGVRVNSLHPAYIDTQMADYGAETLGAPKEELDAMHPIGHMGEPEDVAYAVLYLASDESKFMTGSEMVLDGGLTAQ